MENKISNPTLWSYRSTAGCSVCVFLIFLTLLLQLVKTCRHNYTFKLNPVRKLKLFKANSTRTNRFSLKHPQILTFSQLIVISLPDWFQSNTLHVLLPSKANCLLQFKSHLNSEGIFLIVWQLQFLPNNVTVLSVSFKTKEKFNWKNCILKCR